MTKSQKYNPYSTIIELLGWYGAVAILSAYTLNNFSIISNNQILYQFLNLSGGLAIAIISIKKKTYQPATLNIIWSIIALIAILNILI